MARGKNSTALFEVIHTAKKPPKASPTGGGIPAPKWWSKGGKSEPEASADVAPPAGAETSGGTRRSWLAAARDAVEPAPQDDFIEPAPANLRSIDRGTPDPVHPAEASDDPAEDSRPDPATAPSKVVITRYYPPDASEQPWDANDEPAANDEPPISVSPASPPAVDARPSWAERRARVVADRSTAESSARPAYDPTADVSAADLRLGSRAESSPAPRKRPRAAAPAVAARPTDDDAAVFALDRSAGEVRFRLSYSGAILAGVILLLVIVIAFLAGHASTSDSTADTANAGRTSNARATPSAVVSADAQAPHMMAAVSPAPDAVVPPAPTPAERVAAPTITVSTVSVPNPTAAPGAVVAPVTRQVGMLYVIVQSYPDQATADRAAAFLTRNGIPADVIPSPAKFAMTGWSSVIARRPFSRSDHSSAAQDYQRRIAQLGPQFSNRAYNQFLPELYTWKADFDAARP